MKNLSNNIFSVLALALAFTACVDEDFEYPQDAESEELFILALDADEGGALESETDYGLEVAFQDYFGELPEAEVTISFEIKDAEGLQIGPEDNQLHIKEIIYEIDDCTEGELDFTFNAEGTGTITLKPDPEIGMPEAFEVVFSLPYETVMDDGEEENESLLEDDLENEDDRGFVFEITGITSDEESIVLSPVAEFEYIVLDNEKITAEWELDISEEAVFDQFKEAFSPINADLAELDYSEVNAIKFEFQFEELAIKIELIEEEADECDPTDFSNKEIEIEAEYGAEDGELELEGSYLVFNEGDGEVEAELDFILQATYEVSLSEERLTISLQSLEDEDNFNEEAYYNRENAYTFNLNRD
ncbi:hypothetical protein JKA74_10350 [Marivirga sp. S37H4]|uniref:Uncharacterized protein n=1 Tax=Marivirga aurantiaca TaxID=2802615 RepID=A0A935C988_9BACT|nr:hypothetical protein [Marivirga aurantiaca]MBK6265437.1 hypothetical protein [Marivirga aurantiaca]